MRRLVAMVLISMFAAGCGKSASSGGGRPAEPASPVSTTSAEPGRPAEKTPSSAKSAFEGDSPFKVIEEKRP